MQLSYPYNPKLIVRTAGEEQHSLSSFVFLSLATTIGAWQKHWKVFLFLTALPKKKVRREIQKVKGRDYLSLLQIIVRI